MLLLLIRGLARPLLILLALAVVVGVGAVIGQRAVRAVIAPPLPGPTVVASRLRAVQDLATSQVVVRTVQRSAAREDGLVMSNTDELLCRMLVTGDYGFDLSAIGPERVVVRSGHIRVRLPAPQLLAPGFTVSPAEILDSRTTRWISDAGPGHLAAMQRARTNALAEAPQRIAELGIDREVRDTTRAALKRLLPSLLGQPGLSVIVDFEDEPEPPAPAMPKGGAG